MIDCISVENMRLSDAYTIEHFVPGHVLMYRAAWGVFKAVSWQGRVAILVGSGNNGGDGFALANILKDHGIDCTVFTLSQCFSEDSTYYANQAKEAGIPIVPFEKGCLGDFSIAVDCLLGTGFRGRVRDDYRAAIEEINASSAYVVSVDINSGMNGDTGEAELAVCSDLTVTIGYVKTGLVTGQAGSYIKKLACVDIGIVLVKNEYQICGPGEPVGEGCIPCPDYLDLNVIRAY